MAILCLDVACAREVFTNRPPTALEIRVALSFKAPFPSELLIGGEFEQLLDNGSTNRDKVEQVINRLVEDKVLVPHDHAPPENKGTANTEHKLAGEVAALGLLSSGIAGDLAAMGNWAQQNIRVGEADPMTLLVSLREQLTQLRRQLIDSRQSYLEDQGLTEKSNDAVQLHLGCGTIRSEGWIDIDIAGGDLRMNLGWTLPFPDESVRLVYSANTFEHLDYHTSGQRLLHEIHRVLIPGGTARLVMPDIGAFAKEYAAGNKQFFKEWNARYPQFAAAAGYRTDLAVVMRAAGSATRSVGWFEHKMGYDFATLSDLLQRAGFAKVEHSSFGSSQEVALQEMDTLVGETEFEQDRLHYSLFVDAQKAS